MPRRAAQQRLQPRDHFLKAVSGVRYAESGQRMGSTAKMNALHRECETISDVRLRRQRY